jgi:hypothetical protein
MVRSGRGCRSTYVGGTPLHDYRADALFDIVGGKIRGQRPYRNYVIGSDLAGSAGPRVVTTRAEPSLWRACAGGEPCGDWLGSRLGTHIVATTRPLLKSSGSLMIVVNKADLVKVGSAAADARGHRWLGANGGRGGRLGGGGTTARRGR